MVTLFGVGGGIALAGLANVVKWLTSSAEYIRDGITWTASLHGFGLNFFDITSVAFAVIDFFNMAFCAGMYLGIW
jgi:hypothetical protein